MEEADYRTTFELEEHNWWFVGMRDVSLAVLDDGLRTASSRAGRPLILDIGCGTGIMLTHLARRGHAVGLDISATGLAFCRQRHADGLVLASGAVLPFPDDCFDAVTAFGVVEHIEDDRAALAEWHRVLRPDGTLVLLTSAYRWLWSGHDVSNHHYRRYVRPKLRTLLHEAGFDIELASYANAALFPAVAAARAVERLARRGRPPRPRKDTAEVPRPVNRLLAAALRAEGRVLRRRPLPFGVSILVRARKR